MKKCKYTNEQMMGAIKFEEELQGLRQLYFNIISESDENDEDFDYLNSMFNALSIVEKLYSQSLYYGDEDVNTKEQKDIFYTNYKKVIKLKDNIKNKELLNDVLESLDNMEDIIDDISSEYEKLIGENCEFKDDNFEDVKSEDDVCNKIDMIKMFIDNVLVDIEFDIKSKHFSNEKEIIETIKNTIRSVSNKNNFYIN